MKTFLDTWGWMTLVDEKNEGFAEVRDFVREYCGSGGKLVTTTFILDETISLVYGRLGGQRGEQILDQMVLMLRQPYFQLEEISMERFRKTVEYRRRYRDKPDISFTDLTSMVVMRELGITDILTGDQHFAHVNLGFRLIPEIAR